MGRKSPALPTDRRLHRSERPGKAIGSALNSPVAQALGARILEQEKIGSEVLPSQDIWWATHPAKAGGLIRYHGSGPTQIIAGTRCLVLRHLGNTVEVPAQFA